MNYPAWQVPADDVVGFAPLSPPAESVEMVNYGLLELNYFVSSYSGNLAFDLQIGQSGSVGELYDGDGISNYWFQMTDIKTLPVPKPGSMAILGTCLLSLLRIRRRRACAA